MKLCKPCADTVRTKILELLDARIDGIEGDDVSQEVMDSLIGGISALSDLWSELFGEDFPL